MTDAAEITRHIGDFLLQGRCADVDRIRNLWSNGAADLLFSEMTTINWPSQCEESITLLAKAGISDVFLKSIDNSKVSYNRRLTELCAAQSTIDMSGFSPRLRDVAVAIEKRGKPSISPFSGEIIYLDDTIDTHTFVCRSADRVCIVVPERRIDQFASDYCWYFPEANLLLQCMPVLDPQGALRRAFDRLIGNAERFEQYFARTDRKIMVSEDAIIHLGHNMWNIVSGWSRLFDAIDARQIDVITYYKDWRTFGGVSELFPKECSEVSTVMRLGGEVELFEAMLDQGATSLVLLDNFVSHDLAGRISAWSTLNSDVEASRRIRKFRMDHPIVLLVTIRVGNRCWVEQTDGLIAIINTLAKDFPGIGVVIDGLNAGLEISHVQMDATQEQAIAEDIINGCPDVDIFNTINCPVQESIIVAMMIDAFLAPIGAGMAKYRWIANKPGVAYSNTLFLQPTSYDGRLYDSFRDDPTPIEYVDADLVETIDEGHLGEKTRANFSIDWKVLHGLTRTLLRDLSQAG